MKNNKNINYPTQLINELQWQLDLMDSMQPQLEFFNLHQVEIDNALCIQDSIAGIIEAQDTLTTSLGSYYDRQQL